MNIENYSERTKWYISQSLENYGSNNQVTIDCCNELEKIARENSDEALLGFALFTRGKAYYLKNEMEEFYNDVLDSLGPLEAAGEWDTLVIANNLLGILLFNQGNTTTAIDYYGRAGLYCRLYNLEDLEWIVQVNIGSIYLCAGLYEAAAYNYRNALRYLKANQGDDGEKENIAGVYVGLGKCYLHKGEVEKCIEINELLEKQYLPYLGEYGSLVVRCFQADYYSSRGMRQQRDICIEQVQSKMSENLPILEVFEDVYDYLKLLLDVGKIAEFEKTVDLVERLTERTTFVYNIRRITALKLENYKQAKNEEKLVEYAVKYYELSKKVEENQDNLLASLLKTRGDLTEMNEKRREIEAEKQQLVHRSQTDALTGIPNRFKLNEYESEIFAKAAKEGLTIAVEILDIDYFKQYNDNYGHQAGDNCIKAVAEQLKRMERHGGIFCARYGGDEFVLIYEGYTYDQVKAFGEELKNNICEMKMEHKYSLCEPFVTVSQGICWGTPWKNSKIWDYLHEADEMLYEGKKESRNSVRITKCSEEKELALKGNKA